MSSSSPIPAPQQSRSPSPPSKYSNYTRTKGTLCGLEVSISPTGHSQAHNPDTKSPHTLPMPIPTKSNPFEFYDPILKDKDIDPEYKSDLLERIAPVAVFKPLDPTSPLPLNSPHTPPSDPTTVSQPPQIKK